MSVTLYAAGLARMGPRQRAAIAPRRRVLAYAGGVATIIVALFSPIDELADASFAWHMAQHLLLMLVAAPLMSMGNAHLVALMAFPIAPRRRIGRTVNRTPGVRCGGSSRAAPPLAGLAFAAGLWLWHAPRMYDAALADPTLHTIEHLTFLVTSAVFWRMISTAGDRRLDGLSAVVIVTLIGLQGNLLAALITLAPLPLYLPYAANGLSDQQVAGLLMWLPAGMLYLASSLRAILMIQSERSQMRRPES
ncbi:cytochrome c oxidase assembly protein [Novosphingobium sp. Gsoil 351]|uniref:cytochrome c oxidase assembly protein n=1 Tax=Novosphingobium sp. Gsoil 351 TaxID=2675225 RepID=UPI0018A80C3A|nr:cytochrome c oxidase assembly protein [Novosphingobium sp. Gsoil 351]